MPTIDQANLVRMRDQLVFDGPYAARKLSRFWVLLVLAAVIASSGIVADSTATVIGAMIVAPLMTPILGTIFSVVTGDHANLGRSLALVASGAVLVIAIGWLFGWIMPLPIVSGTNSQVAGRVHPQLVDLLGALATGAVGAFALIRSDVSDTLPGVAIAISLVPPLAVVGLTLEAGAGSESVGALLLFLTNVGAIWLSGLLMMALYGVQRVALAASHRQQLERRLAAGLVVGFIVLLCVPLGITSVRETTEAIERSRVEAIASIWANQANWRITSVGSIASGIEVDASGGLPSPDPQALRQELNGSGLGDEHVVVHLAPSERVDLPAH